MKNIAKRIVCVVLIGILCGSILIGSTPVFAAKSTKYSEDDFISGTSTEFSKVLENDLFELYYKESTAEVALKNKTTGATWYTNPQDRDAAGDTYSQTYANMSSQLIAYYFESIEQLSMDSFSQSTSVGQTVYQVHDDTLIVQYDMGIEEFKIEMLSPVISKKRMEKELLPKLSEKDKRDVLKRYVLYEKAEMDAATYDMVVTSYPIIKKHDIYVLASCPTYIGERIYKAFVDIGYTLEDLENDCKENEVDNNYIPPVKFRFVLEYKLTKDGMKVQLDTEKTEYDPKIPPVQVDLLPFFGAGSASENGYIFVPDGSGAVINFNNKKVEADKYWQPLFGEDYSRAPKIDTDESLPSVLPVFAVAKSSGTPGSFFASIDEGYECAGIMSDIAGGDYPYNFVAPFFQIIPYDKISISNRGNDDDTSIKYPVEPFSGNISISYHILDKYAEYDEIAVNYRNYLNEKKLLADKTEDKSYLNIEFIGTARVKKNFLGFVYTKLDSLTTFEEATEILNKLKVENVDTVFSNALSGGKLQKEVKKIKTVSVLGSASKRTKLSETAKTSYFSFAARSGASKTSKSRASYTLSREITKIYTYDLVSKYFNNAGYAVLLKPSLLDKQAKSIAKSFGKKGIEAVNLTDVAYRLDSDFNRKNVSDRREVRIAQENYLKELSKKGIVSGDYGSIFSLKYLSKIWNMPTSSSGFAVEDKSVPFYAIVARGSTAYVAPSINKTPDAREAFLKAVEIGAQIRYSWIHNTTNTAYLVDYTENYFDCLYSDSLKQAQEYSAELKGLLDKIGNSKIIGHRSISDSLKETKYDSGYTVYVNYAEAPATVNGQTVEAEGFLCVKTAG